MPGCLHVSSVFHLSNFLFFDEPSSHSFFFAKTLPLPPSQFHSRKTIMVFFFWVKNSCRALHCHRAVVAPFFFFFFFFFLVKKKKKTLPLPPQFHSWKQSWLLFFFFLVCQKILQSITLSPCSGCSFLLLFFFLFLSKKISQKLSLLKRKFCLKLSRTLMRVQRLIECYGWSFNNGDLVLWVCNFFFLLIKIALIWTARTVHDSQNRAIKPQFVRVPAFFAWSGFWC